MKSEGEWPKGEQKDDLRDVERMGRGPNKQAEENLKKAHIQK